MFMRYLPSQQQNLYAFDDIKGIEKYGLIFSGQRIEVAVDDENTRGIEVFRRNKRMLVSDRNKVLRLGQSELFQGFLMAFIDNRRIAREFDLTESANDIFDKRSNDTATATLIFYSKHSLPLDSEIELICVCLGYQETSFDSKTKDVTLNVI